MLVHPLPQGSPPHDSECSKHFQIFWALQLHHHPLTPHHHPPSLEPLRWPVYHPTDMPPTALLRISQLPSIMQRTQPKLFTLAVEALHNLAQLPFTSSSPTEFQKQTYSPFLDPANLFSFLSLCTRCFLYLGKKQITLPESLLCTCIVRILTHLTLLCLCKVNIDIRSILQSCHMIQKPHIWAYILKKL